VRSTREGRGEHEIPDGAIRFGWRRTGTAWIKPEGESQRVWLGRGGLGLGILKEQKETNTTGGGKKESKRRVRSCLGIGKKKEKNQSKRLDRRLMRRTGEIHAYAFTRKIGEIRKKEGEWKNQRWIAHVLVGGGRKPPSAIPPGMEGKTQN